VEESPEVEGRLLGLPTMGTGELARRFGARDGEFDLGEVCGRRNGRRERVPETVRRLRGRRKALKGEPHERIWYETRPADAGRMKAPGG